MSLLGHIDWVQAQAVPVAIGIACAILGAFRRDVWGIIVGVVIVVVTQVVTMPLAKEAMYYRETSSKSAEAKFAVETFAQCKHPGWFSSNPDAYCRQMVIDLASKQHGDAFTTKVVSALDEYVSNAAKIRG